MRTGFRSLGQTLTIWAIVAFGPVLARGCEDPDGGDICNACDNCVFEANAGQDDCDADGAGDTCDPTPRGVEPPQGTPRLNLVGKNEPGWNVFDTATGYDVVIGGLTALRRSQGDITDATRDCLADDLEANSLMFDLRPESDGGLWFLVRKVNSSGTGSYDTGANRRSGVATRRSPRRRSRAREPVRRRAASRGSPAAGARCGNLKIKMG